MSAQNGRGRPARLARYIASMAAAKLLPEKRSSARLKRGRRSAAIYLRPSCVAAGVVRRRRSSAAWRRRAGRRPRRRRSRLRTATRASALRAASMGAQVALPASVRCRVLARRSAGSSRRSTRPASTSWSTERTSDGPSMPSASASTPWRTSPSHAAEHHDRPGQRLRHADVGHRLVGRGAVAALQHRQRHAEPHQRVFARLQGGVGVGHGSCLIVSLLSIIRVSTDPCSEACTTL
jgi:hypothetical protein